MLLRSVAKLGNAVQCVQRGRLWPMLDARAKLMTQGKILPAVRRRFENVGGPFGDDRLQDGDGEVEDASRRKEGAGSVRHRVLSAQFSDDFLSLLVSRRLLKPSYNPHGQLQEKLLE